MDAATGRRSDKSRGGEPAGWKIMQTKRQCFSGAESLRISIAENGLWARCGFGMSIRKTEK